MAKTTNYDAKIATIEEKISKKKDQLKKLKDTLADLQEKKNKADYNELIEYMQEKGFTLGEVIGAIKD